MATTTDPPQDFLFFAEIVDAYKIASASSATGDSKHMQVAPFLEAMTKFLRIFDALGNAFFTDVVKKDVEGNIKKLRNAAAKTAAATLDDVVAEETRDPKMLKNIKSESNGGGETGTVALLWMKRMMQFVCGLLKGLVADASVSLPTASRKAYSASLKHCHNFITKGVFDTGLRFAPSKESFFKKIAGGGDVKRVDASLREFLGIFEPQLNGLIAMYKARSLEPYIK